jgi:RND family efflux transporter MFP subunit
MSYLKADERADVPCAGVRALALLSLALLAGCGAAAKTNAPPVSIPTVEVADVAFKPIRSWDDFTGRLEAVNTVEVRPRVAGQITSAPFVEGARVKKGQLLFQIDPRPFQAEADRLSAQVDQARAKAQLAAADADRGQRLLAQQAIASEEAERLTSEAKSAKADLGAAQAALRAAELNLSFTRVVSPIEGRVSKAMITAGNLISTSDLLTTVVSDGPIYASFNADEQTFLKYEQGQRGQDGPVYMGLMTETGFPHQGRLHFLDNAMDVKSGTITARAIFDNADGAFTPGLFARVRLLSRDVQQAALVPEEALGTDLGKRYVLVLAPGDVVQYRAVTLGRAVGELRIVTAGLNPGDQIVVEGLQKVKPGDKVAPVHGVTPVTTAALNAVQPAA